MKPTLLKLINRTISSLLFAALMAPGSGLMAQEVPAATVPLKAAPVAPAAKAPLKAVPVAPVAKAKKSDEVTVITSDRLLYDYKNAFAVFDDNVVVIDPDLKLTSDNLLVRFDENGEVEFLEAKGQVYIQQEGLTARSELATYDVKKATIILQVNPMVQREGAMLTGDTVIYYRDEGRLECFPNARLIIPSDKRGKNIGGK